MVAPNGARRGKLDHPSLPVTLPEIVESARSCHSAGAQALHLHVRDDHGAHTLDTGRYREALEELAQTVPTMRVQITTEAVGIYDVPAQISCLDELKPDWASVSVREIARAPELAERLYKGCAEQGTEIQHILYDNTDLATLIDWNRRGIVAPEQNSVLLVLGRYDNEPSNPDTLTSRLKALPDHMRWMVCAFGRQEHDCLTTAATLGGDLRVGFENSLLTPDGQPHADNAASVAALVERLGRLLH